MKKLIPQKIKNIYHLGQAILAGLFFGFPGRKIKVIGVTGTNGKTTTCQMIAKILEGAGFKVAMASTINFKIGQEEWVNKTKFTTLSSWSVQKFIRDSVREKCDYLILETSSHSLDQFRIWGINFEIAVITNITREHLDYHQTMKNYRKAKLKLFRKAKTAVVNLDMKDPEEFLQMENEKQITYSLKNSRANILAKNIDFGISETRFVINDENFRLNLIGGFNVENALATVAVGISEGIKLSEIKNSLEKIKGVPGRMEYIPNDKNFNIIVDYAVTPDSLEKLYNLIEKINQYGSKIIAVFGACGERDRGKRPIMGEIVGKSADFAIVTNEDPYGEDPKQIIDEVFKGVKRNKIENENAFKILDRREAIKKALALAGPNDFIVVTGKGAEETMAVGKERISWNDKKVIQEVLQELKSE